MTRDDESGRMRPPADSDAMMRRIDELERMLAERHQDVQGLSLILDQLPLALWTTDPQLKITSSTGAALADLGLRPNQLVGTALTDYLGTDDPAHPVTSAHLRALSGEEIDYASERMGRAYQTRMRPFRDGEGRIIGCLACAVDVTERKRAEESQKRAHDLLRAVADGMADAIYVKDTEGRYVLSNAAGAAYVGLPLESALGRDDVDLFGAETAQRLRERDLRIMATGRSESCEERLTIGGVTRTFWVTKGPYRDREGRIQGVLGVSRDITERKQVEAALQESEARYRVLFEANPQPMWVYDPETLAFLDVNQAAVAHYGYTRAEFLTMTTRDIRPSEDVPAFLAELAKRLSGRVVSRLARHVKKDGTVIEVETIGNDLLLGPKRVRIVLVIDVTERRRLEAQLHQVRKMEAVGRLAGGIAHDFNNLLTVINGYCQILSERLASSVESRNLAEEIGRAGERAAGLTRQLLAFSRRQVLRTQIVDFNALVSGLQSILTRMIGEDVALIARLDPALRNIEADPGQIEQVLMNLVVNARDAMPDGGCLFIETRNVDLAPGASVPPALGAAAAALPGPHVRLTVRDTGIGMDEATRARIFEPFFTTKGPGEGTGLGLATVYGIVKQSGGHIEVDSAPGVGTTFTIDLPATDAPAEALDVGPAKGEAIGTGVGRETILLVEDEPALRDLARHVLRQAGYTIIEAADGVEALERIGAFDKPIDLVVTDVVMPRMGGKVLVEHLLRLKPGLKVLFLSGYADDYDFVTSPEIMFLRKPFLPTEFLAQVRRAFDGR